MIFRVFQFENEIIFNFTTVAGKLFCNSFFLFVLGVRFSSYVPEGPTSELHAHTKQSERDTTVRVIVDVNSSVKPVRV